MRSVRGEYAGAERRMSYYSYQYFVCVHCECEPCPADECEV